MKGCIMTNENRGLASSNEETKKRGSTERWKPLQDGRGLEAADKEIEKGSHGKVEKHLMALAEKVNKKRKNLN